MSHRFSTSDMTKDDRSSCNGSRERLGLSFTIDYLLFNKGVKGLREEATGSSVADKAEDNLLDHHNPKLEEVGTHCKTQDKCWERSETHSERTKVEEEEGDKVQEEEGEEEVTTTTTTSTGGSLERSAEKPNQSYIALISKAILASEVKKLLLCDIYQWIMDHYPYFKSKDKNWRNSVRHNLSLNDCFIKAGRSENGKGHFWAIHPANYQDFSKGDYHCRRARRRIRRSAGQPHFPTMNSPYHLTLVRPQRVQCWCCPRAPGVPLSCLGPRLYWPWSNMQPQMHLQLGLNPSVP